MRNHKRGLPLDYVKKHIWLVKLQMCFLLVYSLLPKITTSAIIKATAMIVIVISVKNNMYIIFNNSCSIICLTSFTEANHICYFSFSMFNTIQHFITKNKRTLKSFTKNLFWRFCLQNSYKMSKTCWQNKYTTLPCSVFIFYTCSQGLVAADLK